MKLKFDANQDYQLDAIRATVELFDGQPDASQNAVTLVDGGLSSLRLTHTGIGNNLAITSEQWLANCREVQAANNLPISDALDVMRLADGTPVGNFPNFT